jgi:hypothetical protein
MFTPQVGRPTPLGLPTGHGEQILQNGGANSSAAPSVRLQLNPGALQDSGHCRAQLGQRGALAERRFSERRRNWQRGTFQNGGANGSAAIWLALRPGPVALRGSGHRCAQLGARGAHSDSSSSGPRGARPTAPARPEGRPRPTDPTRHRGARVGLLQLGPVVRHLEALQLGPRRPRPTAPARHRGARVEQLQFGPRRPRPTAPARPEAR